MLKVVTCLAYHHDYAFVVVAAVVCLMTSVMTVRLFDRAARISLDRQLSWVILSGTAGGASIWATHFVAMLGFQLPFEHGFNHFLTITSLAIAIGFTILGLYISVTQTRTFIPELGGIVIGAGIAAMHFTGMLGFEGSFRIEWDWKLVLAAILLALIFGALTAHLLARRRFRGSRLLAMLTMVLAICTMHFTAMGAATIVPVPTGSAPIGAISNEFLAVIVLATLAVVAGTVLYFMDVRSQRELVDTFKYAALHDPLTRLPNRASVAESLPQALERAKERGEQLAIIVIDLDRFKEVNDVHGHHAGDLLLQTIAERFMRNLLPGEMVARVGGDEFVAVKQLIGAKADIDEFAHRLAGCALEPVHHGSNTLSVGASIGISIFPDNGQLADELIGRSDLAMYRAKRSISSKICYYTPSMDEGRRQRSALTIELRHALERDEFELYYQPQLDMRSGEVKGYEALLRWNHCKRGVVSPSEFIPIAEETGLIVPIGEWVLKTACREAAGWAKPYKIAVNIASAQLTQVNLARMVHETLISTGLPASRLELEITEASIIEDRRRTLHVIRQLKALGVTIAMDDYGTGYSSLLTLKEFPFDKVKIDRSFIKDVTTDDTSAAIVKATILLASSLKMSVLAEGVEWPEQAEFLRAEGCTELQGFLLGRPQPLNSSGEVKEVRSKFFAKQKLR